jgi:hypothetical protein
LIRLHVALVHWPVYDLRRNVVCTNVTNFDIHDIARACRTYGVERYYIVNPVKEQLSFVARVLDHWRLGEGSEYNATRKKALEIVRLKETVEACVEDFATPPLLVMTSGRKDLLIPRVSFADLRTRLQDEANSRDVLLVFGTGSGMTDELLGKADVLLEPIRGAAKDAFWHLSVRSAASIVLDRLLGQ